MNAGAVPPAGLLDPRRAARFIRAIDHRLQTWQSDRQRLGDTHRQDRDAQESSLADARQRQMDRCRSWRREALQRWDTAEETLIASYERETLSHRSQRNRLAALYRRKQNEEQTAIQRKVDARTQAVLHQYENRKLAPGQQMRKDFKLIDEALARVATDLDWARALTIRRLDRLPEVPPPSEQEDDPTLDPPDSVKRTVDGIDDLNRRLKTLVAQLQSGLPSKIVDSFYLPAGTAVFVAVWMVGALIFASENRFIWAFAGLPIAFVLAFTIYLILLWPLKKMTRTLYPQIQRVADAAAKHAEAGKTLSENVCRTAEAELVSRRDAHLEAAKRWREEQLATLLHSIETERKTKADQLTAASKKLDQDFDAKFAEIDANMRQLAENTAAKITAELSKTDQEFAQAREASAARRHGERTHLESRVRDGIRQGIARLQSARDRIDHWLPSWSDPAVVASDREPIVALPVGFFRIADPQSRFGKANSGPNHFNDSGQANDSGHNHDSSDSSIEWSAELQPATEGGSFHPEAVCDVVPLALHRRTHNAVIIRADADSMAGAVDWIHAMLWRAFCLAGPAGVHATLIDPIGRGQNFTPFMALADHDPMLVHHRVWTTTESIEAKLSELAHWGEDVLQSNLRDRFETIEEYNAIAGSMGQPYRVVAAVGLPTGLTRDAHHHLQSLIRSGRRLGVTTLMVVPDDAAWPSDMPEFDGPSVLNIHMTGGPPRLLGVPGWEDTSIDPIVGPAAKDRTELVAKIGRAATDAATVEVPLGDVLDAADAGAREAADTISIPIGSQGAGRTLAMTLGEGVRQHVLIAGKTGSGKSSLLHAMITSAAYHYRPDQLQLFLLDFKKGVEFKPYAESGLPHLRVVGIESEREFGVSVLKRLDEELQIRGESFRAAGVNSLADFRRKTGSPLPRLMLVVDEFQEWFVRDDRVASDAAMYLDRLVRQGRSFGVHVIMASQSLAGAYSLPRATLGQMAVRVALQCGESDAGLIFTDDNMAARLLKHPGEAIYNDASGLVEGNQPMQVAFVRPTRHVEMLASISARDQSFAEHLPATVVFEGNRACRWTAAMDQTVKDENAGSSPVMLLGESVRIGPPTSIRWSRQTGRNVLLITSGTTTHEVLMTMLISLRKSDPSLPIDYFHAARADDPIEFSDRMNQSGIAHREIKPRDTESRLRELVGSLEDRDDDAPMQVVVIDPLDRFRDLRQSDRYDLSFSNQEPTAAADLQRLLRDGPAAGILVIITCGSAETLSRWLPRSSMHDLELKILGPMTANDSSLLIDSNEASQLSAATLLVFDESDGSLSKFRHCELPDPDSVRDYLESDDDGH